MRILFKFGIISLLLLACLSFSSAQGVALNSPGGTAFCAGYGVFNQASVRISSFPAAFPVAQSAIVYNWYVRHEKGQKVWHTTSPQRLVPLPWPGTYTVWVEIHYVDISGGQRRRYAVYYSDPLTILAHVCGEETNLATEKY